MASSKVMATKQEMPCQPSSSSSSLCPTLSTLLNDLQNQQPQTSSSPAHSSSHFSIMDDLLKNIYSNSPPHHAPYVGVSDSRADGGVPTKSVDEVWKEIVAGGDHQRLGGEAMTLEDFLTKAGAVSEEDIRGVGVPVVAGVGGGYRVDHDNKDGGSNNNDNNNGGVGEGGQFQGYGNGMLLEGGRVGGRGKRRAVEEAPLDKASQQKQRRMIKNRESAARSRERKQAYTVELESQVTQLEEENARLLQEEAEENRGRFQQLLKNLIPVVDKRRPRPLVLRRVNSVQW